MRGGWKEPRSRSPIITQDKCAQHALPRLCGRHHDETEGKQRLVCVHRGGHLQGWAGAHATDDLKKAEEELDRGTSIRIMVAIYRYSFEECSHGGRTKTCG